MFYAGSQRTIVMLMPELPEVETSRRGIAPWVENQEVTDVVIRDRRLRWPVPLEIDRNLPGRQIQSVRRRGTGIGPYRTSRFSDKVHDIATDRRCDRSEQAI